jgi:Peptidase family M48
MNRCFPSLIILLLFAFHFSFAQKQESKPVYVPLECYTEAEMEDVLDKRKRKALKRAGDIPKLRQAITLTTSQLKKLVKEKAFLKDPESELILKNVMDRLVAANDIPFAPQQILIMRNPTVNAICFGEGTFAITTGMLSRISSESILAYLLAHELAHYELDHLREDALLETENRISKKIKKGFDKIAAYDNAVKASDIDSLKKWAYGLSDFSRQQEAEADSLGLVYTRNAKFEPDASLDLISILDSARSSKYPLHDLLYSSFNSTKVPFKREWLNPRLSVFEKESTTVLFFSIDSLNTHPELSLRRANLFRYLGGAQPPRPVAPKSIIWNADIENVESALLLKRYDEALMLALQLIPYEPVHAPYLKAVVAKILIDLYNLKDDPLFQLYVPLYTGGYSKDLRTVNTFLNNIHKNELGELAWDYMNRKGNFDPLVELHYYQLWRICNSTGRDEVKDKVKKTYKEKFGKGEYYHDMDNPLQLPKMPKIYYTN